MALKAPAIGKELKGKGAPPQTVVMVQGWRTDVDVDLTIATLLDEAPRSPAGSSEHHDQEVGENPDDEHVEDCCARSEKNRSFFIRPGPSGSRRDPPGS